MRASHHRAASWAGLGAAALLVAGPLASGAVAQGDTIDDGLWYATQTSIPAVHEITRGAGVTIAVIDGPINPDAPDLAGTDLVTHEGLCANADGTITPGTSTGEQAEHATAVVSMLIGTGVGVGGQRGTLGVAPEATVLHYDVFPDGWDDELPVMDNPPCFVDGIDRFPDAIGKAIDQAVADGADIINFSINGSGGGEDAIARAHQAGVIMVAGVANDQTQSMRWPADANGVIAVEINDTNVDLVEPSMVDPYLTVIAPGKDIRIIDANGGAWDTYKLSKGSSLATPFVAGVLALAWSVHPEATANQMIQSLTRNTGDEPDHEPGRDTAWGYGTISTRNLVATDPTGYPDENPLLRPFGDPDAAPPTELILGYGPEGPPQTAEPTPATEPDPEPSGTAVATDPDDPVDPAGFPVLPVALGSAALLTAALTLTVILARRPRTGPPTGPTA